MIKSGDFLPEGLRNKPFFRMVTALLDYEMVEQFYLNVAKLRETYDFTNPNYDSTRHVDSFAKLISQRMVLSEANLGSLVLIAHGIYDRKGTVRVLNYLLGLYGFDDAEVYDTAYINDNLAEFGLQAPLDCAVILRIRGTRANDYAAYQSMIAAFQAFVWICVTWDLRITQEAIEPYDRTDTYSVPSQIVGRDGWTPTTWAGLYCPTFPGQKTIRRIGDTPDHPKYWEVKGLTFLGNVYSQPGTNEIIVLYSTYDPVYSSYGPGPNLLVGYVVMFDNSAYYTVAGIVSIGREGLSGGWEYRFTTTESMVGLIFGNACHIALYPTTLMIGPSMFYSDWLIYKQALLDPDIDPRCHHLNSVIQQEHSAVVISEEPFEIPTTPGAFSLAPGEIIGAGEGYMGVGMFGEDGIDGTAQGDAPVDDIIWDLDENGDIIPNP